jgi:methylamine---glutamate N-methyltransferase subunit C
MIELDIDLAAQHLAKFLTSCIIEMQLAVQAVGKNAIKELDRNDLVTVEKNITQFAGIRYAGIPREGRQENN